MLILTDSCDQQPTPTRIAVVALIGCLAIGLVGCRTVQASMLIPTAETQREPTPSVEKSTEETGAETEADSSRWPGRWGNDPANRGVIVDLDRPWSAFRAVHHGRYYTMRSSEIEYADAETLAGALGMDAGFKFKAEGPGSFLFVPRVDPNDTPGTKPEPDMAFKFVSAHHLRAEGEDFVRLERTWFTYRSPADPEALLGTVVLLPGMFGTPEPVIDGVEGYLESHGWAVLRMMSHPSGFTGHKKYAVDLESAVPVATIIAGDYDQRTAECAYATDAALRYVQGAHPEINDRPVVLLGMSGGAMVLPAVYTYTPDAYDAAVLVAGGANSMLISAMSSYIDMIDAVRLDYDPSTPKIDGKPTRTLLLKLSEQYLKAAKLDAFHTAEEMHEIPVLMLHATRDKAVPSKRGEDLYKALGQPERWKYPVGHELIFAALPTQIGKIHTWLLDELDLTPPPQPQP